MGAGCIRSPTRYKLQVEPPESKEPSTPVAEPQSLEPTSPPSPSRTVGELKARLRDVGWKLPANVMEKSELEALVQEAERQKAAKDAKAPGDASPGTSSSSVAQMKRRMRELGYKVPSNIVEKSELKTLLEEAEREAADCQGRPTAPPRKAVSVNLGSQLQQLGVHMPGAVVSESEIRNYLKEAVERQPTAQLATGGEAVTLTCTRGAAGVAQIQVQGPREENLAAANELKLDPKTLQRGENIGHGSFGSVFKAMHSETGLVIAVKEVHIDVQHQPDERLKVQLENEIDLMRSLRHPHIVSYYGCHWSDGHLQMYLEYMAGGSLSQVLSNFGPLEENLMAQYTQQLLSGLEYLHTQNPYILHRDIKGANVLVGVDSLVKLADFGCSKRAKETTSVSIQGSIPWMAPEVLTHSRFGRAGDIWSFGCLVIEMAAADAPWGHFDNLMAAILKIGMSGELPPIPDTVSPGCRGFIRRCTQLDPGKRLSATELLHEDFVLSLGNSDEPSAEAEPVGPASLKESLPPGWEMHFDASQSAWYYWHSGTGRSQWNPPDDETETEETAARPSSFGQGAGGRPPSRRPEAYGIWVLLAGAGPQLVAPVVFEDLAGAALEKPNKKINAVVCEQSSQEGVRIVTRRLGTFARIWRGPEDKLGCGFDKEASRTVTKVVPDSLAEKHQVALGFILVSVNGQATEGLAGADIKEQLKNQRPLELRFLPQGGSASAAEPSPELSLTATEEVSNLGFGLRPAENKLFVKKVDPDGWAAQHGVKEDDELFQVAGQDAGSLSKEDLKSAMRSRPVELRFLPAEPESNKEPTASKGAKEPESQKAPTAEPSKGVKEPESQKAPTAEPSKGAKEPESQKAPTAEPSKGAKEPESQKAPTAEPSKGVKEPESQKAPTAEPSKGVKEPESQKAPTAEPSKGVKEPESQKAPTAEPSKGVKEPESQKAPTAEPSKGVKEPESQKAPTAEPSKGVKEPESQKAPTAEPSKGVKEPESQKAPTAEPSKGVKEPESQKAPTAEPSKGAKAATGEVTSGSKVQESGSQKSPAPKADKELAVLKEQLAKSSGELQKAQTELSQELQKSLASQQQLQQLKDQLASRDQDLQKAKEELSAAQKKAEAQVEKDRIDGQANDKLRSESSKREEETEVKEREHKAADRDFGKRIWESAEVRELKRQVELEVQSLRSELEGLKAQVDSMRSNGSNDSDPSFKKWEAWSPAPMELFKAAQPLLRQGSSEKQRSQGMQAVEAALQSGESPNTWKGPGSPLQAAVQARSIDLATTLLRAHADPGEIDVHGVSLLHLATFHGEAALSKLLLEANANPNVTDRYAQTPIFFAPTRLMCMTLHKHQADVNMMNRKGQSALHLAARAGLGDVLHWLAAKAEPAVLGVRDASGQRALDYGKAAGLRPQMLAKLEGGAKSPRLASPDPGRKDWKDRSA
ncbi:unnamed protein product [Effrenium voratum]|nr:unnamed protein product [Effrenium voratum]